MNKDIESKLDALLENRAKKETSIAETERIKAAKAALAEVRYCELRDNVVLPGMLEVGSKAQQRGIEFQIVTDDVDRLRTTIRFFLKGIDSGIESQPSLTVMYAWPFENIAIIENDTSAGPPSNSGGTVGLAAEVPIHRVTQGLVQERLLNLLSRVL